MPVKVCVISLQGIFSGCQFVSKMIQRQTSAQQFHSVDWMHSSEGNHCMKVLKPNSSKSDRQLLHVDMNSEDCHGMDDTSNELRSQFAPNLSNECKAYIERLLLMDVSVDAIMDIHLDDPIFHDMLKKRDSFITRKPFIMGIQTSWMLDMMVRFSHDSIISMDLTFATNKYRRINAFITDDASVEIHVIESVFECRVILCIWHMRRAWFNNVYKYAMKERAMDIFHCPGATMMTMHESEESTVEELHTFFAEFSDQPCFIEYFYNTWCQ
ncbi:hypothetical protein SUGI_0178840 [Cryptomeria japonica]|nr:hypothetical protein SUGI_0178840 [Cryptomeria japonica]